MRYKTIKISEETHKKIKAFCDTENLKLNKWCDDALIGELLCAIEYSKIKNETKNK